MIIITHILEKLIKAGVEKAYPQCETSLVQVQPTKDANFGDFQTNFAMTQAKVLGKAPRAIAEELIQHIPRENVIAKIDIAGPGFINIFITDSFIADNTNNLDVRRIDDHGLNIDGDFIIDYSSPNIAKRMHIGHLRSTIIGDAIKRVHKFLGYKVIADNHIGDWGTHFGKLMVAYRQWLNQEAFDQDGVEELERLYVEFNKHAETQPEMEELARLELKKLQDGDKENSELWKTFVDASLQEYNKIYSRLDVEFDTYRGESYYHSTMPSIVDELMEKKIATEDQGAKVVFFDEDKHLHPCIVQKKDGAYLYATSDLACIKVKIQDYSINKLVYLTDNRQGDHFRQVFDIADTMGMTVPKVHIDFGVMKLQEGHFATRKGNVIYLYKLLDEAERRAFAIVNEKNPGLTEDEKKEIARVVGIGAVKYADLSQNRSSDIIFDWDKILSFEGNTAPYLQYVYARIQSLLKKAEFKGVDNSRIEKFATPQERQLAMLIHAFPLHVIKSAQTYRPNVIADYAFELSQAFNNFYNGVRILQGDADLIPGRLLLSYRTAEMIKNCLGLLGIEVVDRM